MQTKTVRGIASTDFAHQQIIRFLLTNFGDSIYFRVIDNIFFVSPPIGQEFEVMCDITYRDPSNLDWGTMTPGIYRIAQRGDEEAAFDFFRLEKFENGNWLPHGYCESNTGNKAMPDWRGVRPVKSRWQKEQEMLENEQGLQMDFL